MLFRDEILSPLHQAIDSNDFRGTFRIQQLPGDLLLGIRFFLVSKLRVDFRFSFSDNPPQNRLVPSVSSEKG